MTSVIRLVMSVLSDAFGVSNIAFGDATGSAFDTLVIPDPVTCSFQPTHTSSFVILFFFLLGRCR